MDPVVPARSAEIEKALQPILGLDWIQEIEDQDSTHLEHCSVEQDLGHVDPSFSPSPVEPLGQGGSREKFKQCSHQSEHSDKVQDYVLEAQRRASHQVTLHFISGHDSKPQEVSKCKLGYIGERML